MSKTRAPILFALCYAVAACADRSPAGGFTGPKSQRVLALGVESGNRFEDTRAGTTASEDILAQDAATGGGARGHAAISNTIFNSTERYSFIALSTEAFPNGKGQFEGRFVDPIEGEVHLHADVTCLAILGNHAWISGPITKFERNGQKETFNREFLVRVADLGEGGSSSVDLASPIFFRPIPQTCRFRNVLLAQTPSDDGNIQVRENGQ